MSYFGTRFLSAPDDLEDDGVVSPDGRYFVKVTHRGVLPGGFTEGTLWLFETAAVLRAIHDPKLAVPAPLPLLRMEAAVNGGLGLMVLDAGNAISSPRWSPDSRSLMFLGRNGHSNHQLFTADLETHAVHPLTPPDQDVLAYSGSGAEIVYLAAADADLQAQQAWVSAGPGIPEIVAGTDTPLMPLLYPHFRGNAFGDPQQVGLWRVQAGLPAPVIDPATGEPVRLTIHYPALAAAISPDAGHVVTVAEVAGSVTESNSTSEPTRKKALEYTLIDLHSGRRESLARVSAQRTGQLFIAWSADGSQIALTEVAITGTNDSNGMHGATDAANASPLCDVAVARFGAADITCALRPDPKFGVPGRKVPTSAAEISRIDWMSGGQGIRARYKAHKESAYADRIVRRHGSAWSVTSEIAGLRRVVELTVSEGLNDPPKLVVTDPATHRSRAIFDPNPQFGAIALGRVRVYRWKDPHGWEDEGGLALPPDFNPARRYPLVIQTHGFNAIQFFRAGYSDTANAGRALAGRDIVVLQVHEPTSPGESIPSEGTEFGVDVYLAAVDQLAAEGVIDPDRVGISGYSYSGWLVANAITHAPGRFAAAEIANSDPITLTGYNEYVGTPQAAIVTENYVGARPYGDGLKTWMERAPSFNTDKITAPVLFQPADPWHLLSSWDMYAALRDQGKPVELQYIRTGEHNIRKPLQVLAHEEMLVDWFDFWLNGHEDPAPAKATQYDRWRHLRDLRQSK
ncbi:MAG TPA: prolyl oligopeptidase family serine peptidase [Steroidobacteraceae bacterium]|nr:prolyl oligopeptidase family serine peptidase [Steroidobacteraceae bacterium]